MCAVLESDLVSFFYKWLTSFPSTKVVTFKEQPTTSTQGPFQQIQVGGMQMYDTNNVIKWKAGLEQVAV